MLFKPGNMYLRNHQKSLPMGNQEMVGKDGGSTFVSIDENPLSHRIQAQRDSLILSVFYDVVNHLLTIRLPLAIIFTPGE